MFAAAPGIKSDGRIVEFPAVVTGKNDFAVHFQIAAEFGPVAPRSGIKTPVGSFKAVEKTDGEEIFAFFANEIKVRVFTANRGERLSSNPWELTRKHS